MVHRVLVELLKGKGDWESIISKYEVAFVRIWLYTNQRIIARLLMDFKRNLPI